VCVLFDLIDHRDRVTFHRNAILALGITEQLIAAELKAARTLIPDRPKGLPKLREPVDMYRLHAGFRCSTSRMTTTNLKADRRQELI
jgi:hypothetical protein